MLDFNFEINKDFFSLSLSGRLEIVALTAAAMILLTLYSFIIGVVDEPFLVRGIQAWQERSKILQLVCQTVKLIFHIPQQTSKAFIFFIPGFFIDT